MANLETRVEKLEQAMGQIDKAPDIVCSFVRPEDKFCCGHLRLRTGEQITQDDDETDAAFLVRAKAAGFEGVHHE